MTFYERICWIGVGGGMLAYATGDRDTYFDLSTAKHECQGMLMLIA